MTFEEKVERLSAIEDIKQLKARYCQLCDAGYDPDGIAAMFVEDGVWDGGEQFGCHVGREAIHGFFSGVSSDIVFAAHLVLNPIITVDGDTANGKWWLIMPCTTELGGGPKEARWLLAEYDDDYVRVDGTWYYKHLRIDRQARQSARARSGDGTEVLHPAQGRLGRGVSSTHPPPPVPLPQRRRGNADGAARSPSPPPSAARRESQARGASARRLREMNEWRRGPG